MRGFNFLSQGRINDLINSSIVKNRVNIYNEFNYGCDQIIQTGFLEPYSESDVGSSSSSRSFSPTSEMIWRGQYP